MSREPPLTINLIKSKFPKKRMNFVSKQFYPDSLKKVIFFAFENILPSCTDSGTVKGY